MTTPPNQVGQMSASRQSEAGFILRVVSLLVLGLCVVVALIVYGQFWPRRWQARVPMTNTRDVERSVGKPIRVTIHGDGSIQWDYTHWWSGTAHVYFHTNGNFYRIFTEW